MNNSTVDGADNNQAFFSEERGRTRISYVISQAAVREFQVNTSNFSAEYGRAAGAVVNAVTRSGGNHIHGSALLLHARQRSRRHQRLHRGPRAAIRRRLDHRTDQASRPPPAVRRNPRRPHPQRQALLLRHLRCPAPRFPAVAAAANPSSLFAPPCVIPSHYAGTQHRQSASVQVCTDTPPTSSTPSPAMSCPLQLRTRPPSPPSTAALNYLASLLGPVPRTADHQIALAKLDYHLNSRNTLSLTYNRLRWDSPGGVQTEPVVDLGIASFGFDGVKVDTLTARLTSTLGHSHANELRYSWSRDFEYQVPQSPRPANPSAPAVSRPPLPCSPAPPASPSEPQPPCPAAPSPTNTATRSPKP